MNLLKKYTVAYIVVFCGLVTGILLTISVNHEKSSGFHLISHAYAEEGHASGGHTGGQGGSNSGGHASGGHDSDDSGHDSGHDSDDSGHESGKGGKGKGDKEKGSSDKGHGKGHAGREAIEDKVFHGGGHSGQGGPSDDSDASGPRANKPDGTQGSRPAWAQEGLPDVELGRLNVARSPGHVLDRALSEVLKNTTTGTLLIDTNWYSMKAEDAVIYLQTHPDLIRVDSPLENLALFRELLTEGQTRLPGVSPASTTDLAAIFLGSASDKTIPISTDTVKAVDIILGITITNEDALAIKADAVRSAIQEVHDR